MLFELIMHHLKHLPKINAKICRKIRLLQSSYFFASNALKRMLTTARFDSNEDVAGISRTPSQQNFAGTFP